MCPSALRAERHLWLAVVAAGVLTAAGLLAGIAAPAASAGRPGGPAAVQRAQDAVISSVDFEGSTFPPSGWSVVDNQYDPAEFQWDRETCQVQPGVGGTASAWALGGGSQGSLLACGADYSEPVDTALVYGPIDTTGFPGGLRMSMTVWLDMPDANAFVVCATYGPGEADFSCFSTGVTSSGWTSFSPLEFPQSTGRTDNYVWINYRDRMPVGGYAGAFVDNIVLQGVGGSGTPSPSATPSRTATSGLTPTPSATPSFTPSATPTLTPTGTFTLTPAVSSTPSATLTPGATAPTQTPSPTLSPTLSPTASATVGLTGTAPPSATATPTGSPPPTSSASLTPVEPSPSSSATTAPPTSPSPSESATEAETPEGTLTAEPSESATEESTTSPGGFAIYLPFGSRGP